MPTFGYSKLEAVNRMLMARGIQRANALDSTGSFPSLTYGSSDAANAEYILDLVSSRVQTSGWPCNTTYYRTLTSASSKHVLPNYTLNVIAAGANEGDIFSIKKVGTEFLLYDVRRGSTTFSSSIPLQHNVTIHLVELLDYEACSPDVKELIAVEAAKEYLAMQFPDPLRLNYLSIMSNAANATARRLDPRPPAASVPPNPQPMMMQPPAQQ